MFDIKRDWPKILFAATVSFGIISFLINYVYTIRVSNLAVEREAFDQVKTEYNKSLSDLGSHFATFESVSKTILTPSLTQNCTQVLGGKICIAQPKMVESEIKKPLDLPDRSVQNRLDQLNSKLEAISGQSQAAQTSVSALKPINDIIQTIMKIILSLLCSIASLYIIISRHYNTDSEKWAYGTLGTIIGFWLGIKL